MCIFKISSEHILKKKEVKIKTPPIAATLYAIAQLFLMLMHFFYTFFMFYLLSDKDSQFSC